jgi:LmbE family N-acetylglucosaminyl deacetylase
MPAEAVSTSWNAAAAHPAPLVTAAPPVIQLRSEHLATRLGRTLLLVPHYDDECAAGGLLQQLPDVTVLFLTDGAPRDPYFWQGWGSREAYSALRKRESVEALAASGIRKVLSIDEIPGTQAPTDQELYRSLPEAFNAIHALVSRLKPKTILAPAYEGGHPDHDASSFLAAQIARHTGAEHWELPYYHRRASGEVRQQEFLQHLPSNFEITLWLSDAEITRKRAMWSRYQSQCAVLNEFAVEKEIYREAPQYAWDRPPHPGVLNYEAWRWRATGREISAAFQSALRVIG